MCGVGRGTLASLVGRLPATRFAFAYGSAVKLQQQSSAAAESASADQKERDSPLVDLCACVRAAECASWHRTNLELNGPHYSFLRLLGAESLAHFQRGLGAGVYFNTLVPAPDLGVLFKYGLVAEEDLLEDLDCWSHLYFAGRLHKPVRVVVPPADPRLGDALRRNLLSALRASLLLLPERFSRYDLFHTVSHLSYSGDFRMTFGENKNKVANIVTPQLDEFRRLYESPLSQLQRYVRELDGDDHSMEQDAAPRAKFEHLISLPSTPKSIVSRLAQQRGDADDAMKYVAGHRDCSRLVETSIRRIVWRSSVRQSIKGIFTAGIFKSLRYSGRKIQKMFA
ncbi:phosphatidate cytidylyltransferase, mitochondrial [Arctopsyche grandis]|uniref:phosphatidate cytidylyltransferase, mitochondrial n=1 Tax=Arctopsyche grandis TaxID=121162 RepID=UPI00406D9CA2